MELDIGTRETPVVQKTRELCETIVRQDQFADMLGRIDRFLADPSAQALYQEVSDAQERLAAKQEEGTDLSAEEIDAYERQRETLFANEVAGGFVAARQEMQKVQDTVMRYVGMTFELGRVPTEDDLQSSGGCCGGGGGGGGCGCSGG